MVKYNSAKYRGNFDRMNTCGTFMVMRMPVSIFIRRTLRMGSLAVRFLFDMTPAEFGLDGTKPAVIGEFPAKGFTSATKGSRVISGSDCCIALYEKGWNGAFAWTSNNIDICGGLPDFRRARKKSREECQWDGPGDNFVTSTAPDNFVPDYPPVLLFDVVFYEGSEFSGYFVPREETDIPVIHHFKVHAVLIVDPYGDRVSQGIACGTL